MSILENVDASCNWIPQTMIPQQIYIIDNNLYI